MAFIRGFFRWLRYPALGAGAAVTLILVTWGAVAAIEATTKPSCDRPLATIPRTTDNDVRTVRAEVKEHNIRTGDLITTIASREVFDPDTGRKLGTTEAIVLFRDDYCGFVFNFYHRAGNEDDRALLHQVSSDSLINYSTPQITLKGNMVDRCLSNTVPTVTLMEDGIMLMGPCDRLTPS